jgi:sugar phosphate isomerase/epimerase
MSTQPEVVLSSTCFQQRNLPELCELLIENGIDKVELSGNIRPLPEALLNTTLSKYQNRIKFFIHNYFPPPFEPIVLNLAHPDSVAQTIKHCQKAIDLCAFLGNKNYSLHAGSSIAPRPTDLGKIQTHLIPITLGDSRRILEDACLQVAEYAHKKNVRLLLENNVVASFNCPNKVNDRYHFSDLKESQHLLKLFNHPHIGVLLDTGHLKVSSTTLGFDPVLFVERFKSHICVVQISDNDGTADQNLPARKDSWFWEHLPWRQVDYVSLEVCGEPVDSLLEQLKLTEALVADSG